MIYHVSPCSIFSIRQGSRQRGTGIAAQAPITHGIKTTIVEVDPVIYQYAREYFGFAATGTNGVHLSDHDGYMPNLTR